jgi:cytidylate kinase
MRRKGLVIAIDGPSGAGKSTVGRALAERLGYLFVDTGAMYRALAFKALERGVALDAEEALADLLRATSIELVAGGRGVKLDGRDVTVQIRSREVTAAASRTSTHASVRRAMVAQQRELGREGGFS